jgi:hypothetical protein
METPTWSVKPMEARSGLDDSTDDDDAANPCRMSQLACRRESLARHGVKSQEGPRRARVETPGRTNMGSLGGTAVVTKSPLRICIVND